MDFSDEPYVRKYTRKTLTWKLLGWEGRAVLDAMLGEFDAAGLFAIRGDAAVCISAVTDIPIEVVRTGLARLVETETWVVGARVITWPSYEEAQNCRRSDRLRQRESRRARSAQAVTDVTSRHGESRPSVTDVTSGHIESPSLPLLPPSAPSHPERPPTPTPVGVEGLTVVAPIGQLARFVPDGWQPNERHRVRCQELRFELADVVTRFRRQEFQRPYSDWDKRFDLWLDEQKKLAETERFQASRGSGIRTAPGSDLDTTGAACAYRPTSEQGRFCGEHGLPLETAVARCRGSPRFAALGTFEQQREFSARLRIWKATGAFPDPNEPLKRKAAGMEMRT